MNSSPTIKLIRDIKIPVRLLEVTKAFWSKANDTLLGIKTMPHGFRVTKLDREKLRHVDKYVNSSLHDDESGYESPDYANLRKIISFVNPQQDDVVFDLGCGMGRVVCMFAKRDVKRCVGIELFPQLCNIAEQNVKKLRRRTSPIEIRQGDVALADFSEGNIFFLFNPFGASTLRDVLARIDSQRDARCELTFIYYKDLHADVLESCGWLDRFHQIKTFSKINVSFWRTRGSSCRANPLA